MKAKTIEPTDWNIKYRRRPPAPPVFAQVAEFIASTCEHLAAGYARGEAWRSPRPPQPKPGDTVPGRADPAGGTTAWTLEAVVERTIEACNVTATEMLSDMRTARITDGRMYASVMALCANDVAFSYPEISRAIRGRTTCHSSIIAAVQERWVRKREHLERAESLAIDIGLGSDGVRRVHDLWRVLMQSRTDEELDGLPR